MFVCFFGLFPVWFIYSAPPPFQTVFEKLYIYACALFIHRDCKLGNVLARFIFMWHPKCFVPVYENFTRIKIPYWSVYTCILEFIIHFLLVKGSILYPNISGACWLLLERWAILIDIFKKGINLIAKKKQCQSIWRHSDRFYNIEEPNSETISFSTTQTTRKTLRVGFSWPHRLYPH